MHVRLEIPLVRSISLWEDSTDERKSRPDIFHPVYRVGILFTSSLFARVSGGIVISGRLIRPTKSGVRANERRLARRKHIHLREKKGLRAKDVGMERLMEEKKKNKEKKKTKARVRARS